MDNKTVFVRTSKGEDEVHSRTMHLPGDIKRALLMVDGKATFGEIYKHAAPSLRPGLEAMLQELEKDGYVVDKAKSGNIPKMPAPPKMSVPPRMSVPTKMATPHKAQAVDEGAGDLDFMSGFSASSSKATETEAGKAAVSDKLKAEAAERARQEIEIEAAKFQAQQEAEATLHKAEQETARIREEAERAKERAAAEALAKQEIEAAKLKAQQEAEAILHKAEQEAARIREEAEREKQRKAAEIHAREEAAQRAKEEAEAAKLKVEQAVKARLEAEAKALQQAEAARRKAEQEAAIAHETAERLAMQEKEIAKAREEAEKRARKEAETKTETHPATKPDTFAFDAFHVDEPQPLVKPHQAEQPAQKASSTEPEREPAVKRETFSFDSFKIEIPDELPVEPPTKEKVRPAQQQDDAARAVQHPETRQHFQKATSSIVASKPAGDTPSKEEIQRASQERLETETRMDEEALAAKKHAEVLAKAHAEEEQRKAEIARAEMEQTARQAKFSVDAAPLSHVAKSAPVARVRRKPFSLGRLVGFMFKLGVFLLLLLLGALFAAPYIVPTRDYIPPIEKLLSAKLHQPVHIGYLSGRILPAPRLDLSEIYIGDVRQFQTEQAQINFAIAGLITEAKPIDSIELQGVKVSGKGLQKVSAWMQQLAADTEYPVARMVISRGTLDADAVKLSGVEGALEFNQIGEFTKANLRSNDGKYRLDLSSAPGNKLQATITLRDSALPLLPNWSFEELSAKGMLSNNDLTISEFDGRIVGGILQGNASIDWHSGWRAQGTMVAKSIPMQRLNRLLEGNVEGTARFKLSAVDLAGLADSATLDGSFMSKSGMISGMDIVGTARTRSREHLPGGRTHFDELSGIVTYSNNALHFKQIKIITDVLNANASLDFDKQQISGSINAKLSLQEVTKPADLQIGGAIDSPTLRFVQ